MIFDTPYDCTAANYSLKSIQDSLRLALSSSELGVFYSTCHKTGMDVSVYTLVGDGIHSNSCPMFNHPIHIYDPKSDRSGMCVDMRQFGQYDKVSGRFKVRAVSDATFALSRACLTHYWVNNDKSAISNSSNFPMEVYSSLLSQTIARRFSLDPSDQISISILAGYYYHCLFEDTAIIDEVELMKISSRIARFNRVSTSDVFNRVKELGVIDTIEDLCNVLRSFVGNVRLQNFDAGVLLQIVCGNWAGTNARENLAVALEHPPTWWSICYFSLSDAGVRRTVVGKLAQTLDKAGEGDRFQKIYEQIVDAKAIQGYLLG